MAFGIVCVNLVLFSRFGLFGPRKIWQPWLRRRESIEVKVSDRRMSAQTIFFCDWMQIPLIGSKLEHPLASISNWMNSRLLICIEWMLHDGCTFRCEAISENVPFSYYHLSGHN
jgi:hypothetical protein